MSNPIDIEKVISKHPTLATWQESTQQWKKIPIALDPVLVKKSEWSKIADEAALVASSFPLLHDWLLKPKNSKLKSLVYAGLSGIEAEIANQPATENWGHATWRFDLFWDNGLLKIIETNCTIPAMQAYSDIVLQIWSDAAKYSGPPVKNSLDLLESLLGLYRQNGGVVTRPHIVILHRPGDSQIAELQYFQKIWHPQVEVTLAVPDDIALNDGHLLVKKRKIDVIYRHIFAWHLEKHPVLAAALRCHRQHHIYNPVSAHYEAKAFFALLSQVADSEDLSRDIGLPEKYRTAIKQSVPWTRIIPNKNHRDDILDKFDICEFCASPANFVVKNSIGYGGHQVIMGSLWDDKATQEKLRRMTATSGTVTSEQFWKWLLEESDDTWIIQRKLEGRKHHCRVLDSQDQVTEIDGYVDASIFLGTGIKTVAAGGVSRFAASPIVNIGTGGGLAPFVLID